MQAGLNMYDLLMAVDVKSLKNERFAAWPMRTRKTTNADTFHALLNNKAVLSVGKRK